MACPESFCVADKKVDSMRPQCRARRSAGRGALLRDLCVREGQAAHPHGRRRQSLSGGAVAPASTMRGVEPASTTAGIEGIVASH